MVVVGGQHGCSGFAVWLWQVVGMVVVSTGGNGGDRATQPRDGETGGAGDSHRALQVQNNSPSN